MSQSVIQQIRNQKIVPLFYQESYEVSKDTVKVLYEAGIRAIEYTNRGSRALENFIQLKEISASEFPGLLLGIGTVKNTEEFDTYADAKADFIITPVISEELVNHAVQKKVLLIPGCFTPSDVNMAFQKGLTMVKIFPADALGKNYIKSIKPVFPGMDFMPTGGVSADADDISGWLKGGAVAVGLGSALIREDQTAEQLTEKVKYLLHQLNDN